MKAVLPMLVLLGVAACGRESASPAATTASSRAGATHGVDDSVAAVSLAAGKPAVQLRFALGGAPRAGVAAPVRLDFSGDAGQVTLRLQGNGLKFEPASAALTLPEDGTVTSRTIQVTPQAAGVSEMTVRIQPAGEGAAEILYAVPLLADAEATR